MVASGGVQEARFVLFRIHQLDIHASELMFTQGLESSTVRFKQTIQNEFDQMLSFISINYIEWYFIN